MIAMEVGDIWGSGSKNDRWHYGQNRVKAMDWNSAVSDSEQAVTSSKWQVILPHSLQ